MTDGTRTEIAVLGAGPAALLLAAECAERGMQTTCVGSDLRRRWTSAPTAWVDGGLRDALSGCLEMSWAAPLFVGPRGERVLDGRYARIDPSALQQRLERRCDLAGVRFLTGDVVSIDHEGGRGSVGLSDGRKVDARAVVVTAGAARWLGRSPTPSSVLSAVGRRIAVQDHPWFPGEMLLADFRDAHDDGPPSFAQVLPLAHDTLFVQEISLPATAALAPSVLRSRLGRRLARSGVRASRVVSEQVLTVDLAPGLPAAQQPTLGFGPAAGMVHPLTGQSLAMAVELAPAAAAALSTDSVDAYWQVIWPTEARARHAALADLARRVADLDGIAASEFFDEFFTLPTESWRGCLEGSLPAAAVADLATTLTPEAQPLRVVAGA